MKFLECLEVAISGLIANKLRSLLTMLGLVIGVSAIVAIVAIAEGARAQSIERIKSLGTNLVSVYPGESRQGAVRMGSGSMQNLTLQDAEAIREKCPSIVRVNPEVRENAQVKYREMNTNCRVYGVGADWMKVRNYHLRRGRMFNERELDGSSRVAIIGAVTTKNLFGEANPIGRLIRVNNTYFRIIGQADEKGTEMYGDADDQITIPITTAMQRILGIDFVHRIRAEASTMEKIPVAMKEIESLLRRRHRLHLNQENDFRMRDQAEFIEQSEEEGRMYTNLLASIAGVSLIVGGIGIMNIMLVSVTERTREIGIRKAIGARNADILVQFLVEAITLSGAGGGVGVGLGILISYLLTSHFQWPLFISPGAIAMSFSFAVAIGLFFGVYPARKAAMLDPIEALRYE